MNVRHTTAFKNDL